jgi:KipI family sensor histidine kinase inhibitor
VPIREAGDSAVILQLDAGMPQRRNEIDAEVNSRAIRIAEGVRQRRIRGVRDVVPTFRSVAVFFDPLATDLTSIVEALEERSDQRQPREAGRVVEVPVVYGGDAGPDLASIADAAGLSPEAVVARHASRAYRVFMLGFLPGFPYMAPVDEAIAAPRRPTPRARVAAGSVGIAGQQTGIYPRESPGGWQIIGRTPLELFDAGKTPPALLAPGDTVRFLPVESDRAEGVRLKPDTTYDRLKPDTSEARLKADTTYDSLTHGPAARFITVLRPGLFTTIQDAGRWGYQHLGVPVSGPMDPASHRLANALLGNLPDAATLEATIIGPELRFEQDATIAITGADLQPMLEGTPLVMGSVVRCAPGSVLRFGNRRAGARAYVAVDGGIGVPPVLGSRATHVMSGLGGVAGRALRAGDRVPLRDRQPSAGGTARDRRIHEGGSVRLRVMAGPQSEYADPLALQGLQETRFIVSPQSDRMGYRLTGSALPTRRDSGEMISDATVVGAVQVPSSGQPILLMADRQTTGGYPQIAVVITADLPLAAQLVPGDSIQFELCSRADAIAALTEQEGSVRGG